MANYYEIVKRHNEERKKIKRENLLSLTLRQTEEIKEEIEKDITGENFIVDMFRYEMNNAEYHINQYKESILQNLDITEEEFKKSEPLMKGFAIAEKLYMKSMEKYFYL